MFRAERQRQTERRQWWRRRRRRRYRQELMSQLLLWTRFCIAYMQCCPSYPSSLQCHSILHGIFLRWFTGCMCTVQLWMSNYKLLLFSSVAWRFVCGFWWRNLVSWMLCSALMALFRNLIVWMCLRTSHAHVTLVHGRAKTFRSAFMPWTLNTMNKRHPHTAIDDEWQARMRCSWALSFRNFIFSALQIGENVSNEFRLMKLIA